MSNSFTSPPVLVDPARLTSGLTIRSQEAQRLADMQNYAFAYGGSGDVLNQAWDAEVFEFTTTSMTDVCQWYIPHPSEEHVEFKLRLSSFSTVSGSTAKCTIQFPLSGNSYNATATITDSSRFNSVFDVITVPISAVEDELYAIVTLSLQAASGATIEVSAVQGSWSPLTSPLASRALDQYGEEVIPQGQSRLGVDLPLSSRFGVETLNNITQMRRRPRTLLNWSGVFASSSSTAKGLGAVDPQILFSEVALSAGLNLIGLDVDIFINAVNIGADPLLIDVFGYRLSVPLNGWNSIGVDVREPEETDRSNDFRLSMRRCGLMDTPHNAEVLLSFSNPITASPAPPYIKGIAIMGV
jgi:hypothetical protein